jgi:hypothetical protein
MSTLDDTNIPDVLDLQAQLDAIEEKVVFIMQSVMLPSKVKGIITPSNPTGEKNVLIPLSVMWNTLQEVRARIAAEKAAILDQNHDDRS